MRMDNADTVTQVIADLESGMTLEACARHHGLPPRIRGDDRRPRT